MVSPVNEDDLNQRLSISPLFCRGMFCMSTEQVIQPFLVVHERLTRSELVAGALFQSTCYLTIKVFSVSLTTAARSLYADDVRMLRKSEPFSLDVCIYYLFISS